MPRHMVGMIMEMPRGVHGVKWLMYAPGLITDNTSSSHADRCIQSRVVKNRKNEVEPELCEGGGEGEGDVTMT
jgi:hypothetical protein